MSRIKNAGELLTTTQVGTFDSLPPQLRAALTVVTERQAVNLDAEVDPVTGGVIQSKTVREQTNEFTKETIRASFPITVTSHVRTDEFGGGTVLVTDTYSLTPPTAPVGSLTIVEHRIENLGTVYHERKEEKTTASWPVLSGQQYEEGLDIIIQFTEQITAPGAQLGNARTEITPIDDKKQRVRVVTANTTALDEYNVSFSKNIDMQLPDVLVSLTAVWNTNSQNATSVHSAADQQFTILRSGSGSFDPDARAQASASLVPDLQVVRRQIWGRSLPVTVYSFLIADNSSRAAILTKLATFAGGPVNDWPVFKPESLTFTLKGQSVSVSSNADTHSGVSISTDADNNITSETLAYRKGYGQGVEVGVTTRTLEIPPTLHGALTISDATQSLTATATTTANTKAIILSQDGVDLTLIPALTNTPTAVSKTITGAITPANVSATSPSSIPTSGFYAVDIDSEPFKWGYTRVLATVINASIFA